MDFHHARCCPPGNHLGTLQLPGNLGKLQLLLTLWGGMWASLLLKASGEPSVQLGLRTHATGHSAPLWLQSSGFQAAEKSRKQLT